MLTHWFKRYLLIKEVSKDSYFLIDTVSKGFTYSCKSIEDVLKIKIVNYHNNHHIRNFEKNIYLITDTKYFTVLAESDYSITKNTHPELFI